MSRRDQRGVVSREYAPEPERCLAALEILLRPVKAEREPTQSGTSTAPLVEAPDLDTPHHDIRRAIGEYNQ